MTMDSFTLMRMCRVVGENGYYAPLYDYRELKKRAEDVLDGATLTDAEKKQYFVSE